MNALPKYVVHRYDTALDTDPVETLTFPTMWAVEEWATEWLRTESRNLVTMVVAPPMDRMVTALVEASWTINANDPESLVVAFNRLAEHLADTEADRDPMEDASDACCDWWAELVSKKVTR